VVGGNQNASRNQNINMSAGIFLAHARSLTLGADLQCTDATGVIHFTDSFNSVPTSVRHSPSLIIRTVFFTGSAVSGQAVIHRATGGNNA